MRILVMDGVVYELNTPIEPGGAFDVRDVDDGSVQVGWIANQDGTFSAPTPAPVLPWPVDTAEITARLIAAGKLRDFCGVMKIGSALADMSDDELARREKFCRSSSVQSDDTAFRTILTGIGADPDAILAR